MQRWLVVASLVGSVVVIAGCGGSGDSLGDSGPRDGSMHDGSTTDAGPLEGGSDAGLDAGSDGGTDAGSDGGTDAGSDGGTDAGDAMVAPSCADTMQNGTETDVDCGGTMCAACVDGLHCGADRDCTSGACDPTGTCVAPTCADTRHNGMETDVDCGGSMCSPCADGLHCTAVTDCMGGLCLSGTCVAANCTDTRRDGTETDVDCGGSMCSPCVDGLGCAADADCTSGTCNAGGICVAPSCTDLRHNGTETDVDCGGSMCAPCPDGLMCAADTDCISGACSAASICAAPSCTDLRHDGMETDVDCGGSTCAACPDGFRCSVSTDCTSGVCDGTGRCAAPSCTDGLHDGSETGIDCGGSCPACLAVVSTTPADGSTGVGFYSTIRVTFNAATAPATLTTQTTSGACTGSVQVSTDGFATCIGLSAAAPAMSAGNSVATLVPAPALSFGSTYQVRVTTAVQDPLGNACPSYTSTGFTTAPPGAMCVGSNLVVISQVYGGGGNTGAPLTNDFIELHNRSVVPVDLTGWTVQYASSAGTTWQSTALSGSIAPGGYFLVAEASGGAVGVALPTPDVSGGLINMAAMNGKVALVSNATLLAGTCPTTGVVDEIGFGTANCFEGPAAAPAGSNTLSVMRAGAGCTDANHNFTDFTAVAPAPRNSATTAVACTCGDQTLNESNAVLEADYCVLQFPPSVSVMTATSTGTIYGRLYEAGVTDPAGASSWIAQLGYGPENVNPENQSGWTWVAASFNAQFGSDDEYQSSFTAPAAGTYRYTYRFSSDGVSWTFCDVNGAGSNAGLTFEVTQLPVITVTP